MTGKSYTVQKQRWKLATEKVRLLCVYFIGPTQLPPNASTAPKQGFTVWFKVLETKHMVTSELGILKFKMCFSICWPDEISMKLIICCSSGNVCHLVLLIDIVSLKETYKTTWSLDAMTKQTQRDEF